MSYADLLFSLKLWWKSSIDVTNRKEIRFPVLSIVALFSLAKKLELLSFVNPSTECYIMKCLWVQSLWSEVKEKLFKLEMLIWLQILF